MIIELVAVDGGRTFSAYTTDGEQVAHRATSPELEAARVLYARGVERFSTRWRGSEIIAMRCDARRIVEEHEPKSATKKAA